MRLGRLARTISGTGFPVDSQGETSGDLPFLKVSDLALRDNHAGIVAAANWVSAATARSLGARLVPPGSIVFPKVGAALLGNARRLTRVTCALDNNLMAVVPHEGNSRYWLYLMLTVDMGDLNLSGTIPFVTDSSVRDLGLAMVTDLDEQRRIADFLDDQVARIDNIVAAREKQVELLGDQFRALLIDHLSAASRADRRSSRLTWLGTIPTKWGEPRICQVARIGTGHTPSRSRPELWQNCTIPWLTTGDVHRFRQDEIESIGETAIMISQLGLENSAAVLHPKGTVALSRTASAGFSIVMARDMATSQDFGTWTCGPRLAPHFLLWCLRAMRSDIMGRLAIGSTHKTIYFPDLMSIRVPLPTLREQNDIVLSIQQDHRQVGARAALHRELVRKLAEMKRSLITAAVTGDFDASSSDGSRVPV